VNAVITPSLTAEIKKAREKKTLRLEMSIEWYADDPLGVARSKHAVEKLFRALMPPEAARAQIQDACALIDGH
jgi:hypothetical protein